MRILLTFTGFHDPYSRGLVGEDDQPGPILSLLRERQFDLVCLLSTPNTEKNTRETLDLASRQVATEHLHVPLQDPTDYAAILKHLRKITANLVERFKGADFYVAVASGTPQMHACWVLLVSSGELVARILHIRPQRFVTKDDPVVSEVDVGALDFPQVRARPRSTDDPVNGDADISRVISDLGIVADHPKMLSALNTAVTIGPSAAPVLILGETGTGKELFARLIHSLSRRPAELFVPVNCAAIPKELAESILFGHKKGSFTGALTDQIGKFQQADKGTLFLDELAELPVSTQAKLLRVLQDGVVEPIGSTRSHKVNVRIVAATNKNIADAIRVGTFREDLYYRLNVGEIRLPALRERATDIPKIALHVLDNLNKTLRRPKGLSQAALARLQAQPWPGNVRDLQNAIERSLLMSQEELVDADDLLISDHRFARDPLAALPEPGEGFSIENFLSSARKQLVLKALETAKGNKSEAARLLGISPQAVHKYLSQRPADWEKR